MDAGHWSKMQLLCSSWCNVLQLLLVFVSIHCFIASSAVARPDSEFLPTATSQVAHLAEATHVSGQQELQANSSQADTARTSNSSAEPILLGLSNHDNGTSDSFPVPLNDTKSVPSTSAEIHEVEGSSAEHEVSKVPPQPAENRTGDAEGNSSSTNAGSTTRTLITVKTLNQTPNSSAPEQVMQTTVPQNQNAAASPQNRRRPYVILATASADGENSVGFISWVTKGIPVDDSMELRNDAEGEEVWSIRTIKRHITTWTHDNYFLSFAIPICVGLVAASLLIVVIYVGTRIRNAFRARQFRKHKPLPVIIATKKAESGDSIRLLAVESSDDEF